MTFANDLILVKYLIRIDDALDLFAEHAVGGIVGLIINAFFGSTDIIAMDGVNVGIEAGWVDKNWKAMYKQIAFIAASCAYTFVMTALIAKGIDLIPGLQLRASPENEILGIDETDVCVPIPGICSSDLGLTLTLFRLASSQATTLSSAVKCTTRLACPQRASSILWLVVTATG